jgi:hypothetical protein
MAFNIRAFSDGMKRDVYEDATGQNREKCPCGDDLEPQ